MQREYAISKTDIEEIIYAKVNNLYSTTEKTIDLEPDKAQMIYLNWTAAVNRIHNQRPIVGNEVLTESWAQNNLASLVESQLETDGKIKLEVSNPYFSLLFNCLLFDTKCVVTLCGKIQDHSLITVELFGNDDNGEFAYQLTLNQLTADFVSCRYRSEVEFEKAVLRSCEDIRRLQEFKLG